MPPTSPDPSLQLALQSHRAGDLPAAENLYRQILAAHPDHPDALHLLGIILHKKSQHDLAEQMITRAISLRPGWREAAYNLSLILNRKADLLRSTGQLNQAIAAYRQAIQLKPDSPQILNTLGVALQEIGNLPDAITHYRQAIALLPSYPEAHNNLAVALREIGQLPASLAESRLAAALSPTSAAVLNNMGLTLLDLQQFSEAITAHRRALQLDPASAEGFVGLGNSLIAAGEIDPAIAAYHQAIAIKPQLPGAHFNLGKAHIEAGDLPAAQSAFTRAFNLQPDHPSYEIALISTLYYQPNLPPEQIAQRHFQWDHHHAQPLRKLIQPHPNNNVPHRRLRIGYVSPDIRQHPVGRFILPLLEHHDRAQFEIFIYSDARTIAADPITTRAKASVDHWLDTLPLKHDALADQIRRDKIDILVDLAGHTTGSRLLTFARKPAPVQVTYLGYPGTTGLAVMDYRLTDPLADPVGRTEHLHSEKLCRLPRTAWCFAEMTGALIPAPAFAPTPVVDRGSVTFGSFNNLAKITPDMLQIWATLLHRVPASRLLLKAPALAAASAKARIQQTMISHAIDPARLTLLGPTPSAQDHLATYHQIDIALDTFPYHGTTTTCEALWMGVPVITLAGQSHVSRVGVSLLNTIGCPDWIATTPEQYIDLAAALASRPDHLQHLRATLRQQLCASPLMDAKTFTTDIENAWRKMWQDYISNAL